LFDTLVIDAVANYYSCIIKATNGMTDKINGELFYPAVNGLGSTYVIYESGARSIFSSFGGK
jgi:hypothetical protein